MAKSFIATMTEVFKKPGQSAGSFMTEIKALSTEDRAWYMRELQKAGYEIDGGAIPTSA
jgi:hypothetical protein